MASNELANRFGQGVQSSVTQKGKRLDLSQLPRAARCFVPPGATAHEIPRDATSSLKHTNHIIIDSANRLIGSLTLGPSTKGRERYAHVEMRSPPAQRTATGELGELAIERTARRLKQPSLGEAIDYAQGIAWSGGQILEVETTPNGGLHVSDPSGSRWFIPRSVARRQNGIVEAYIKTGQTTKLEQLGEALE